MLVSPLHPHCGLNKHVKPYRSISRIDEACRQHDLAYQRYIDKGQNPYRHHSLADEMLYKTIGYFHPYSLALKAYKRVTGSFSKMPYRQNATCKRKHAFADYVIKPGGKKQRSRSASLPRKSYRKKYLPKKKKKVTFKKSYPRKKIYKRKYYKSNTNKSLSLLWRQTTQSNAAPKQVFALCKNIEYTGSTNKRTMVELGFFAGQGDTPAHEQITHIRNYQTCIRLMEACGYLATALPTENQKKYYFNNVHCKYTITNTGNEDVYCGIWRYVASHEGSSDGCLAQLDNYQTSLPVWPNNVSQIGCQYDTVLRKLTVDDSPFTTKTIFKWCQGSDYAFKIRFDHNFVLSPGQSKNVYQKISSPCSVASFEKFHRASLGAFASYLPGATGVILDFKGISTLHSSLVDTASGNKMTGVPGGRIAVKAHYSGAMQESEQRQTQYWNQKLPNTYEDNTYTNLQIVNADLVETPLIGN